MLINSITKINDSQTSFNGTLKPINQILKPKNVEEQIKKISRNQDAKDIFKGLSLLAASFIAEISVLSQQNENIKNIVNGFVKEIDSGNIGELKNNIDKFFDENFSSQDEDLPNFDMDKLTEEKPERETYLKITSYFPNLDKQYKQMLQQHLQEPENKKNEFVLTSIENLFKLFSSSNERLMNMKPYLDVLNNQYSNCLDGIAENISSTLLNGDSIMHYLVLLHNEKLSEKDIYRWAKCSNLSCDEYMLTRILSDEAVERLSKLKETNNHFKIRNFQAMKEDRTGTPTYAYMLDFTPDNLSVAKRLKTAAQIHEAIYGEVYLKEDKDLNDNYMVEDIQNELVDNILKDRRMDATYNFVKFIKPSALREFNYTADEIKFLSKDHKDYNKIKSICSHVLMNLNYSSEKLNELCEVLSDDKIYGKVFTNRHAKIRFITRFVLKDNPNADLKKETPQKLNILFAELHQSLDRCNYFCYTHSKGTAPQFYLKNSKLGNFIKITLNNEGSIHTIYEDYNKELRSRSTEQNGENF